MLAADQDGGPGSHKPVHVCTSGIHLVNAITGKEEFDPGRHHESVAKARQEARLSREKELPTKFDTCVSALGGLSERCARRAKDFSTGAWLSAMPSEKNNTVLSAEEFRDELAMRFNKPLLHLRWLWERVLTGPWPQLPQRRQRDS